MNKEDYITIYSYEQVCDYYFDENHTQPKNGDVVFVQLEELPRFFEFSKTTEDQFIIVSVRSDLGIHEQAKAHPNKDLMEKAQYIDWNELCSRTDKYVEVSIGTTANIKLCHLTDKYSIKTNCGTYMTFNEVPNNVLKWFSCNVNIIHPKIECVPFGIPDNFPIKLIEDLSKGKKDKLLYVNFQENTSERRKLRNHFKNVKWATYHENDLPREEYLKQMSEHKYVLCPFGNGLDTYRICEALYLGCIPVIKDSIFTSYFYNLPILPTENFYTLDPKRLELVFDNKPEISLDGVSLPFWIKRIKNERGNKIS